MVFRIGPGGVGRSPGDHISLGDHEDTCEEECQENEHVGRTKI